MDIKQDELGRRYWQLDETFRSIAKLFAINKRPLAFSGVSIDMTDALLFMQKLRKETETHITVTSLVIKAAANALKNFPILYGLWEGEDKIILPNPDEINIGGPVQIEDTAGSFFINKANQKTIVEISKDIETQITAIREQKKVWEEGDTLLKTPVFLLSSLGTLGPVEFGGGAFPQTNTCILVTHAILEKPAVRDGKIVIRKMMNVGLSWDHRAMDANIPIEFLTQLKKNLEEPYTYLV